MDKAETRHLEEMSRMREVCHKTNSAHLRRDYKKALRRMERELR